MFINGTNSYAQSTKQTAFPHARGSYNGQLKNMVYLYSQTPRLIQVNSQSIPKNAPRKHLIINLFSKINITAYIKLINNIPASMPGWQKSDNESAIWLAVSKNMIKAIHIKFEPNIKYVLKLTEFRTLELSKVNIESKNGEGKY